LSVFSEPTVTSLAAKYGKSPGQVILNWHIHRGILIIPKTANPARLSENLNCYQFKMTDEEYASISNLDKHIRFYNPKYMAEHGWADTPYFD